MERKVLGKGLEALIPKKIEQRNSDNEFDNLPLLKIKLGKYQPRQKIEPAELKELSQSIKEKGFIQPIVVRKAEEGNFEVVAGARRFQVANLLGLSEIPALIKELDDKETFMIAIAENLQRKDLNPLEEALAFKRLMEEFGLSYEEIGNFLGKDKTSVINTVRLLKLPGDIRDALSRRLLTSTQARTILALENENDQRKLFGQILKEGLSVREIERRVRKSSPRARRPQDPFVNDIEEKFQRAIGTKVRINNRKNNCGKIIIEYYSLGDLERIIKHIV